MDLQEKLKKVEKLLEKASDAYYNTQNRIMSDEDFDKLQKYYEKHTGKKFAIGAKPNHTNKKLVNVQHNYDNLVGTFGKINTLDEFKEWLDKFDEYNLSEYKIKVSYKYDGNSIVTEMKNGKVQLALTRGRDGEGVDLTDTFKIATIPYKDEMAVRYEVMLTYENFGKVSELKGKQYANPRSLVAGILSDEDSKKYAKYFTLVPLNVRFKDKDISVKEELTIINELSKTKDIKYNCYYFKGNKQQIINSLKEVYDKLAIERFNFNYMIDGLVIEFVNKSIRQLGYNDNRPRFAVALKFPYMEKTSEVIGIEWEVSPNGTGRITPMVKFKPVKFNGAVQSRISLANYKRYKELEPIGIGTKCTIEYRNDVLSYFTKLDVNENKKIKHIPFTDKCPCCGGKVVINKEETFAYCSNDECPSKSVGRITNYINQLKIKGIEGKTLNKLFENKLIVDIPSIYDVDEDEMAKIEGFGKQSAKNFIDAINENKPYDYEMLAGMGIKGIARKNAKELLKEFKLLDLINLEMIKSDDFVVAVKNIEGFSDIMAKHLKEGLINYHKELSKLVCMVDYKISDQRKPNEKQMKFVITGDTQYFKNRTEFIEEVEKKGHKVIGSVSKNTDYLVNNDKTSTTNKNKKAMELNIPIITDREAAQMLGIILKGR